MKMIAQETTEKKSREINTNWTMKLALMIMSKMLPWNWPPKFTFVVETSCTLDLPKGILIKSRYIYLKKAALSTALLFINLRAQKPPRRQ
jgi:hypothetical protein